MICKATLETPNHPSGAEMITLTGTGPEVFNLAALAYANGRDQGLEVVMRFYIDGREVPWRELVAAMDPVAAMENALRAVLQRAGVEEMPF